MLQLSKHDTSSFKRATAISEVKPVEQAAWGKVGPEQYLKTYGRLKPMKTLKDTFANGQAMHSVPLIGRKPVEVLPRMYSFDPRVLGFIRELSNELDRNLKVDTDEKGFTKTGIHIDFGRLRCPAGYFQNPMSYTTVDNATYREELGLNPGYNPRERAIAEEVWRLVWKEIKIATINVPKLSTSGMRRFTFDVQWKLAFAEWLLAPENFERMLNAVQADDWETLANEYETVYATYIQKRGQVDSPDRVRKVFDLEYALSGGRKGEPFATDKKVVIDGTEYPDFSAIRARVVHAGPWVVNLFLQIVATTAMQSLFHRFPKTFHVNTAEQILEVIQGKEIVCSDVTEYDRSMSRDAIEVAHETMREHWDPRIVKASWRLFTAPYYAKPLDINGKEGVWVHDPRDWSKDGEVFAGNRSGHGLTSLVAKVNKVIDFLIRMDKIQSVIGQAEKILLNLLPFGVVNNGDDEIAWADDDRIIDRYIQLAEDGKNGHYSIKPEVGQGFSGLLLCKIAPRTYLPKARIHTTFEKIYVPERSIGGKHRQFWPIGMNARIEAIMKTEEGRAAWDIHMSLYRKHLAPHFGDLMQLLMQASERMPPLGGHLSAIDKAVLEDPDKLHHKYSVDDVRNKDVLDAITTRIPADVVYNFCQRYYKGHIL